MTQEQYLKNLTVPKGRVDVVLDTDAYNEIDDQFAISYMIKSKQKFSVKGICAAPFLNFNSVSAEDGMQKSYDEILKLLELADEKELKQSVYRGSREYLPDETTPIESEAAEFMGKLAQKYSPENPLYIVAIGVITNVVSAILKYPEMKENCVVIWLGGHATHFPKAAIEFNMRQDIAAARVLFSCGVPLVQVPCLGVVDHFITTKYELEHWIKGKNKLCDYLYEHSVEALDTSTLEKPWSMIIWDVVAVAWLLNEDSQFMEDKIIHSIIPEWDMRYAADTHDHFIKYVYKINRDALFEDLFRVLSN